MNEISEIVEEILSWKENFEFVEWDPINKEITIFDSDMGAYSWDDFYPNSKIYVLIEKLIYECRDIKFCVCFSKKPMRTYQ